MAFFPDSTTTWLQEQGVTVSDYLKDFADTPENYRKVFVGGLSWATTEDRLQQYFEKLGAPVERLSIMRDKTTGRSRGFGFITFVSLEGLDLCLKRRHTLDGRTIECKKAIPKGEIESKIKKVFVGGIPLTLEESALHKYFQKFGPVEDCRIMTDGVSGRSRGFGFVSFYDDEVLNRVLSVPHSLDGKCFEVKRARGKVNQPDPVQMPTIMPVYIPYGFPPNAIPQNTKSGFPGFYVYAGDPNLAAGAESHGQFPNNGFAFFPQQASAPLPASEAPEPPKPEASKLQELEKTFNDLGSENNPANRFKENRKTTPPVSTAKRNEKQKMNRTVSAADKLQTPGASSSNFFLTKPYHVPATVTLPTPATPPPVELTPEPSPKASAAAPTAAASAQSANAPTSAAKKVGGTRNPKQVMGRTVSANEKLQTTPADRKSRATVLHPTGHSKNLNPVAPPGGSAAAAAALEIQQQSYLERELLRLSSEGVVLGRKSETKASELKVAEMAKEKERKRGMSSPVQPLDTIRHLDLNWRSGLGKTSDATIHKYFPVVTPENQ